MILVNGWEVNPSKIVKMRRVKDRLTVILDPLETLEQQDPEGKVGDEIRSALSPERLSWEEFSDLLRDAMGTELHKRSLRGEKFYTTAEVKALMKSCLEEYESERSRPPEVPKAIADSLSNAASMVSGDELPFSEEPDGSLERELESGDVSG